MNKMISMILALAILALTAVAFAEGNTQENTASGMQPPEQTQNGPMTGGPAGQGQGQPPAGEKPEGTSEQPGGEKPVLIDFDAMVTNGVISQETCDKIKTYMEEHKPADMPGGQQPADMPAIGGEKPAEGQTPPEKPAGEKPGDAPVMGGGLLADLLKDSIITQAEYDALLAAQTSTSEAA